MNDKDLFSSVSALKIKTQRLRRSEKSFVLTKRDLGIFKFLLDMKFSSLIQIHQKFFLIKTDGSKAVSTAWASDRIKTLSRNGLLEIRCGYGSKENQYFLSQKGRMMLQSLDVSETHLTVLKGIDIRTFEHDRHVLNSRIALERLGRATHWDSERRMKAELSTSFNLRDQFLPDGIYRNINGDSIAFELEIAVKELSRYREKIEKYMDAFRRSGDSTHPLRGALFVATSELVFKKLEKEISKYPNYFQVERYKELIDQAAVHSETFRKRE